MKYIGMALLAFSLVGCSSTEIENAKETEYQNAKVVSSNADMINNGAAVSLDSFNEKIFILHSIDKFESPLYDNVNVLFTNTKKLGNIVRGNSGCNRYFAKYETIRSLLITSEIVATENKCSNKQLELENFMFKIYSQRPIVSFDDNYMIFETPSNKLVFREKQEVVVSAGELK